MSVVTKVLLSAVAFLVVSITALIYLPQPKSPGQIYEVTVNNSHQSAIIGGKYFWLEQVTYNIPTKSEWTRFCGKKICLEMPTNKIEYDKTFTAEMWISEVNN
jgi:hypothetical protein